MSSGFLGFDKIQYTKNCVEFAGVRNINQNIIIQIDMILGRSTKEVNGFRIAYLTMSLPIKSSLAFCSLIDTRKNISCIEL